MHIACDRYNSDKIKYGRELQARNMLQSLQKFKEWTLEKLEREGRDAFHHECLKTMQEFLSHIYNFVIMLDGKGEKLKSRGWKFNSHWDNTIGKDRKSTKFRTSDSHPKMPMLQTNNFRTIVKNSCEDTSEIESFYHTRFYSELKKILRDGLKMGEPVMVKEFEQDFIENQLAK